MSILELFCTFFYIGLFTIGGGVVAITLMEQTIVADGLITSDQFYNMIAISESTPGPLGTNMATYIGYTFHGIPGGIIATIGEVLPSIIIILVIAHFLKKFHENPFVKGAMSFLRPITTGLILVAAVQICIFTLLNIPADLAVLSTLDGWKNLINYVNLAGYGFFLLLLFKFKMHPIIVILLGALFGILFL